MRDRARHGAHRGRGRRMGQALVESVTPTRAALVLPDARPGRRNRKVGAAATITTDRGSCPDACPFRRAADGTLAGCYADGYPLRQHWDALTAGERGGSWEALCDRVARELPAGMPVRLFQAGDAPLTYAGAGELSLFALMMLQDALRAAGAGPAWGYTHAPLTPANVETLMMFNAAGPAIVSVSAN